MKLYTIEVDGALRLCAEHGGELVELDAVAVAAGMSAAERAAFDSGIAFVRGGDAALSAARRALDHAARLADRGAPYRHAIVTARHRPPLLPGKTLCSGINYYSHLEENPSARLPAEPFIFAKLPNTIIGSGEAILKPASSEAMDYEVELAVVIGRTLRRAMDDEAAAAIAGYTVLHDVSARDIQFRDNQITLGKNFDTFAPLGPCLVTADEISAPERLRLRSWVNGELRQDGSTSDWVFPLPRLLSFLSGVMTLEPGDVVSTGTPSGVGAFRRPPIYLQPGDVVRLEVEGIGVLENPVRAAPVAER